MSGLAGLIITAVLASHGAVLVSATMLNLFAAGTGAVFLGLLPHALAHAPDHQILPWNGLGGH